MRSPILLSKGRNGMKHHKFTELERQELLSCRHIARIKGSNVEYTQSFKAYALSAKKSGKREAGSGKRKVGVRQIAMIARRKYCAVPPSLKGLKFFGGWV